MAIYGSPINGRRNLTVIHAIIQGLICKKPNDRFEISQFYGITICFDISDYRNELRQGTFSIVGRMKMQ